MSESDVLAFMLLALPWALLALVALILLAGALFTVAQQEAGLVERLQEEACSFPKCKTGLETYDAEGNPWCNKHKPADDDE